jgi:hypothetical protein
MQERTGNFMSQAIISILIVVGAILIGLLIVLFIHGLSNVCKHQWKVLSEATTESKAEQMNRLTGEIPAPRNRLDLEPLLGKKLIHIVTCTECGKIKRYVTTI